MRARALLLVAACLLAGCAGTTTESTVPPAGQVQFDDGGANKVDVPRLPSAPPAASERNLTSVPQWRLGEWWEYSVTDHFAGHQLQIRRVVAGSFGTQYLVGFPIDAFSNDALVLHVPGYGDIDMVDLGYETHDVKFQPLSFPLAAGKSWDTAFEGRPGKATVESVSADGATATIRVTDGTGDQNPSYNWTAVYDAEAGELSLLDDPNYATVQLTGHGYGHTGVVRVPHAHDLVFQNGRLGPWSLAKNPTQDPSPDPAQDTVTVAPGYDRLAFTILIGGPNLLIGANPALPASGDYSETVTSPNGTVFHLEAGPTDPGTKIEFFGAGDPTGTWTIDHKANGPGVVLTEGIGYHSIDIELPSGCVLPGPNATHHLNPCTGTMGQKTASSSATNSTVS